jgi:hypothetical protein
VNREELVQLRDAIDMTLALPDSVRELLAQLLAPEASKGNGHDRHAPVFPPTPRSAQARQDTPFNVRTAERRLLAVMQESPFDGFLFFQGHPGALRPKGALASWLVPRAKGATPSKSDRQ